ncbi:aromatic amino acid DMT transporter YddG [Pseudomonas syringae]|uniref:aromatic amino acid DMT transporter YddG n=1 Tax=Pseudomonas syringae TaxID=317 RepID=UPI000BB6248C|nr:aromatic amino acid DMT transporter YddG [Pseudomonas syringae]PBQ09310.1 EamA family transporter [Pseudomonas syringae]
MRVRSEKAATACGLVAILLWSTAAGLIRSVSEDFGPEGGAAMLYSVGAAMLMVFLGRPRLHTISWRYLLSGGILFATYEVCLSLALGYANSRTQAIELGVVNYLWPSLTILLSIFLARQRVGWTIVPGTALALFGILWVVSGDGLAWSRILANVTSNPLSYSLVLTCAFTFAVYCNITRRYAGGQNLVTFFFVLTALALWLRYGLGSATLATFTVRNSLELAVAGAAMAGGYALWNLGIIRGNLTTLACASYCAPVLSSAFAALWLGTQLTMQFWQGALLVTIGSIICWQATHNRIQLLKD